MYGHPNSEIWEIFASRIQNPGVWNPESTQGIQNPRTLSIQPKIPEISVRNQIGTDRFGSVRPEYLGTPLKVIHFNRSGHFGRSDRKVPFHLTELLSLVPLFCIQLTRKITKRAVAWVGFVQLECTVPLGT